MKRAIEYIHENLQAPVTLSDIVAVSGIPGRTLHKHFRHFLGLSPMGYLRNTRFQRVREAILQATPEDCVSAIATSWGFDHFGRFAGEYRRRFGEKPSDTLKRRRNGAKSLAMPRRRDA